ncbi:hypothetical protein [Lentzea albida]|uniref:Uncharacterized protein n=1 Tax=Lentzea albida TaxID=65499 RepID=A0A1H9RPH0_9PSEU|nr:hypothetical protein [Lentzea albida]SER74375.1 hypothetical protein SAMN04488000_111212 [Lentzea albida]
MTGPPSPGPRSDAAASLPHEPGLRRLRTEFGLTLVEHPRPARRARPKPFVGNSSPLTQVVIPVGGTIEADGPARTITVTY